MSLGFATKKEDESGKKGMPIKSAIPASVTKPMAAGSPPREIPESKGMLAAYKTSVERKEAMRVDDDSSKEQDADDEDNFVVGSPPGVHDQRNRQNKKGFF